MVVILQDEIDSFNDSIVDWADRWAGAYCIKNGNKYTPDFQEDIDLYFPTFFENEPNKDDDEQVISFAQMILRPEYHIEDNKHKLTEWKFDNRFFGMHFQNAMYFDTFGGIDDVFSQETLVSLIFWKHIYRPHQYPIFDQRIYRSFLLLHDNEFWNGGVPSGKDVLRYYNNTYQPTIIESVNGLPLRTKLLTLRKIDYALFSFDKIIIKKSIQKKINIDETIRESIDNTLEGAAPPDYTFQLD